MTPAWHIRKAVRILRHGGIIAYPTEGVWGLGCDPLNAAAVSRLLDLKRRDWRKGLILIAADFSQLQPYLAKMDPEMYERVCATWPGPVTWLLPACEATPHWLRGQHDTLAVRVTAHPLAARLCTAYGGALVSTSANVSGRPAARTRLRVQRQFMSAIDYILPGATGPRTRPSEIRDGATGARVRL